MLLLLILVVGIFWGSHACRKAKQTGHNPIHWTVIAAAIFSLTEILVAGGIGFILGFGIAAWGWSENLLLDYNLPIELGSLLFSFFTNWLFVLRPLNKVPDESFDEPPPPIFESNESKLFQKCFNLFQKSVKNRAFVTKPC